MSSSTHPVSTRLQRQQELAAGRVSIAEEHESTANNCRNREECATKRAEEERQMAISLAEDARVWKSFVNREGKARSGEVDSKRER